MPTASLVGKKQPIVIKSQATNLVETKEKDMNVLPSVGSFLSPLDSWDILGGKVMTTSFEDGTFSIA